ncbi:response regulator [Xanthobacter sp. KR7-65]|uniref:response regulator n=1 Tax=Xanthobacter sp. KR7-65 TaxID=3156612 RepID=UPI0032B46DB3
MTQRSPPHLRAVRPAPRVKSRLAGVRLLLAEDNSINQEVARRVLELEGATITVVGDGRAAVETIATHKDAFDAVLMDVQMPVMDGHEATRHIRLTLGLATLPVIALTAGDIEAERGPAAAAGMDDFIAKPFDVELMVATLSRHLSLGVDDPARKAASPPVGAAPALPSAPIASAVIPGVDVETGLVRVSGDMRLLTSLLAHLARQFSDVAERVRNDLDAGRPDDAMRLLHALRGAAGTVAATEVFSIASRAEHAIRAGRTAEADTVLTQLAQAMAALVAGIAWHAAPPPAAPAAEAPAMTPDDLRGLLADLDTNNMRAVEAFERLLPQLTSAFGADFVAAMARAMDDLDFAAAGTSLRAIIRT